MMYINTAIMMGRLEMNIRKATIKVNVGWLTSRKIVTLPMNWNSELFRLLVILSVDTIISLIRNDDNNMNTCIANKIKAMI